MNVEGVCYCGSIRYQAEGDTLFKGQCFFTGIYPANSWLFIFILI